MVRLAVPRWPWMVGAVVAVLGGSMLGVWVAHRGDAPAPRPTEARAPAAPPPVHPAVIATPIEPEPAATPDSDPVITIDPAPEAPAAHTPRPRPHHAKPAPVESPKAPPKKPCNPYDHIDGC